MTHELQPPYLTPTGDSHQTLLTLSNEYFVPGYDNFTTELPESQNATSSIYVAPPELIIQSSQHTDISDTSARSSYTTPNAAYREEGSYDTYPSWYNQMTQLDPVSGPSHVHLLELNHQLSAPVTSRPTQDPSVPELPVSPILSQHNIDVVCKVHDEARNGASCDSRLTYKGVDRQPLVVHLQTIHGIHHTNLNSHAPGEPLIECPDTTCTCRFRRKGCARRDANGRPIPHRTHVVDLIRHYMDKHLQPVTATTGSRFECDRCGKAFTRSGSVTRHQRNNCPRKSHI